jgi:hypothetical protein
LNRNEIIGTFIGKTLGYVVQGIVYSQLAEVINPQNVILLKVGTKYGIKVVNWTSKSYLRTDFKSETIFSDAIDASFLAY